MSFSTLSKSYRDKQSCRNPFSLITHKEAFKIQTKGKIILIGFSPLREDLSLLTLCMLGNFACFFVICGLFYFFFKLIFKTNLSGIPSVCQIVWIQIRPNILLGLIWVQTFCKCYQQTTKVAISGERVKQISNKSP